MKIVFYCNEESPANADNYLALGCCGTVSSMILASFGLAQLGHDVSVLNRSESGTHQNVKYYQTLSISDALRHFDHFVNYDIVIANGWAVDLFKVLVDSSMIRVHWIHNFIDQSIFENLFLKQKVDYGICVSENQLGTWWRSVAFQWMTKIPNCLDFSSRFSPTTNGRSDDRIMFIGATRDSKGFHDALRIFLKFQTIHTSFKLYVAGDAGLHSSAGDLSPNGIFEAEYENRCLKHLLYNDDNTLRPQIILLGRIPRLEVLRHLATTKLALLNPSWTSEPETFSVSALDAQSMGVPVVSTYRGGIPEVVKNGKSGILIKRKGDQFLVDAICKIVEDQRLAASFSSAAQAIAQSKFGVEAIALQWEKKLSRMKERERFHGNFFRAIGSKIRHRLPI